MDALNPALASHELARRGRGRIYDSVLALVGDTPLVRLPRLSAELKPRAEVLAKLEYFNPLSSVKDRIGVAMIEMLEAQGVLKEGSTIVEPTSGNTGIALAFVAAAKGYPIVLTMPESMSVERRKMLALMGARLELTPAEKGMRGAVARAQELMAEIPGAVMPQQFENPANPAVHRMVAVEPEASPVLSGGAPGPHKIQGIGAGFVPAVLDRGVIDEVVQVTNEECFDMARRAARTEGLPVGISSGGAISAAFRLAAQDAYAGKQIVVIVPSFAERYLSTALFEGL